jgi:hypothetical protein
MITFSILNLIYHNYIAAVTQLLRVVFFEKMHFLTLKNEGSGHY